MGWRFGMVLNFCVWARAAVEHSAVADGGAAKIRRIKAGDKIRQPTLRLGWGRLQGGARVDAAGETSRVPDAKQSQ